MTDPTPDRYRHRTEEVEAVQWTGHNADALRAFAGADFDEIELDDRTEDPDETAAVRSHTHGGWLGLTPGDWVVKHADHFSTASDEEFRARWMPAVPAAGLVAVPPTTQTADRAAVPVKQRADCTELEWAEQERARFERLYTREFSRAEKAEADANHNADLVATAARRAEAMERAMESTAADALKHRGCHRDLMGQCLRAERAEAAIERVLKFAASLDEIGRQLAGPEAVHPVAAHIRHLLDTPAAEAPEPATQAAHVGGNAEDCPACEDSNPPYPFLCPGPPAETVHACPPDGSGLTPCCGRTPFELPLGDRISSEASVTCPGATP